MAQSPCPSWRSKRNFKQSKQFSWIFVSIIKPKNGRNNIKVFKMEKKTELRKQNKMQALQNATHCSRYKKLKRKLDLTI